MSELRIKLQPYGHLPSLDAVPIATEIINSDLEVVRRMSLLGEGSVELSPGFYLVRAQLPSGEVVTGKAVLDESTPSIEISLRPSESPHEWLAWQHFLGEVPGEDIVSELAPLPPLWLRVWKRRNGNWLTDSGDLTHVSQDKHFALYKLHTDEELVRGLGMLQIGGHEVPWRMISLPPTYSGLQIMLRSSRSPSEHNGGVAIKVVSMDEDVETLSHYLRSGSIDAAGAISDRVLQKAEAMLADKLSNPYGAMVGGYYLLRVGDYSRLHDWPNNFANWIDWLPDSAVIHAWQILRSGNEEDRPLARQRLLQAADRGLPVYADGVNLLMRGLALFAETGRGQAKRNHENGERPAGGLHGLSEVERALGVVRWFAASMDWLQWLSTFTAMDPARPTLELRKGIPEDPSALHFLLESA